MSTKKKSPAQVVKEMKLSYAVIDGHTEHYDWSEGYTEKWEIGLQLSENEQNNEEYFPMMNFRYPVCKYAMEALKEHEHEDKPEMDDLDSDGQWTPQQELKDKLNNMTIIYDMEDEIYWLALTGGGMDFSWEICETYIALGMYPPVAFCELPGMAGRGKTYGDKIIIEACKKSLKAMADRYANAWTRMADQYGR